ncbi:MAG: metallophosphoesterase family protein [Lachnospiraceae bacterium]|nr:metallophosphoesterase family protein [Lachnospiraceae bacterium]
MRYYIADCHFFHESLNTQMDERGFSSAAEMNEYMIEKWNARVKAKDEVVILGDLSVGKAEETMAVLEKLKGRLYLVRGNHDRFGRNQNYRTDRFEWIRDYAELHDNGRKVVLCHYPVMFYNGQYHYKVPGTGGLIPPDEALPVARDDCANKTWMLYGHVHNTIDEYLLNDFIFKTRETVRSDQYSGDYHIPCQMINCFCMFSDYTPLSLDEWIETDSKRRADIVRS